MTTIVEIGKFPDGRRKVRIEHDHDCTKFCVASRTHWFELNVDQIKELVEHESINKEINWQCYSCSEWHQYTTLFLTDLREEDVMILEGFANDK